MVLSGRSFAEQRHYLLLLDVRLDHKCSAISILSHIFICTRWFRKVSRALTSLSCRIIAWNVRGKRELSIDNKTVLLSLNDLVEGFLMLNIHNSLWTVRLHNSGN